MSAISSGAGRVEVDRCPPTMLQLWTRDLVVMAVTVGTALAIWLTGTQLGARPLVARTGPDQLQEIGPVMVGVAAAVAALAGVCTLRPAMAKIRSGRRWWTVAGITVLVVSLLGPLGATTLEGGLTMVALHLQVGLTVLIGLRRVHRGGRARVASE